MDRKDRKLIKEIIIMNAIIVAISIFLWIKYDRHIGFVVSVIILWASFLAIRIMVNRYGVYANGYKNGNILDRLIRKLMKR